MNALTLAQRVARRIPAYDILEYLDEVNAAYKECWDYICQLDDSYFTDTKIVTVTTQAAEFDLLYNSTGFLSSAVSQRFYQVDRIRILQPNDSSWAIAQPRNWNNDEFLSLQQLTPQSPLTSTPYPYQLFAKGSIIFGRPLPVATQIEVVYSFYFLPLVILSQGQIANTAGNVVTGTGTAFTQSCGADNQNALPGNDQDTDIGVELVINQPPQQTYRVKTITSDTSLTTINPVNPAIAVNTNYTLATVPDVPDGHHNVISTLATRNFMSTPGNDVRFSQWAALAEKELDSMRDSIMTRQRQEPARRIRFPQNMFRYKAYPIGRT